MATFSSTICWHFCRFAVISASAAGSCTGCVQKSRPGTCAPNLRLTSCVHIALPIKKCSVSDGYSEAPETWGDLRVQFASTIYGGSNWTSFAVPLTHFK
eukprot:11219-Heterococcus_DN1.PRE.1